ncbi:hypothetical protein MAM1_0937c11373 [Mucor ambiguus]|uniref:BTB domain-containing protein n=1 Tax=Mucor ambiguus TaxID=91626 RepID=A0A0C9N6V6_9FUNG|nr:hypothetical protein MAM1_0937c11373 [Mucor ambiguus]
MTCKAQLVKLNVGGKFFLINYDTISKSSVLVDKYLKGQAQTDSNASSNAINENKYPVLEIFIDRNGEIFQYILEYLRSQKVYPKSEEGLRKLRHEADYFNLQDLVRTVNVFLEQYDDNDENYDYQVIQHPFSCNYLIVPSQGELKPFQEDDTIVTGYKYCLASNVYESKLVVKRPRKKCKLIQD